MDTVIIPTLMYHSIDLQSSDYLTVSLTQFQRQMNYIASRYQTVKIEDILSQNPQQIPENPILISFDDSLKDNIDHALPILEMYKLKAVFFVITEYLGRNNAWNPKAYRFSDHMSPNDLKDLIAAGYEIGSHSMSHHRLTKFPDEVLRQEYANSLKTIECIVGSTPHAFAYPYGATDERCWTICSEYYKFGFVTDRVGNTKWFENPMTIRRLYISPDDTEKELEEKVRHYRGITT